MGIIHNGEQAVGELLSGMFEGFPDFAVVIIKTYHSDDAVILEVRMKGRILVTGLVLNPQDDGYTSCMQL
jgi:hypothetical protein